MSLIWTESFAGFQRHVGANNDAVTVALLSALGAAGYQTYRVGSIAFLSVVDDPVTPSRAGLRFNSQGSLGSFNAGIAYELPATMAPVIFGFSLFIPGDFIPSGTQPSLIVGLHYKGATDWAATPGTADREAFRVRSDLGICIGSATPQSVMKPALGRVSFFEVRLDGPNVSVWMNDALVHQSTAIGQAEMISLGFTSAIPIPNNWVIGNLYILSQDDVVPNVRLGPSTRVIGRRPATDVQADFMRPVAFASNAAVAAQDIAAVPDNTLQSTTVGTTDIYDAEIDAETAAAGIIHAVAVKTVAANLEAMPHSLKPFVVSETTESVEDGVLSLQQIPAFTTQTLNFIAEHPTKGLIAGGNGEALYYSTDDGVSWTQISDTGGTVHYNHAVFSSNGNGVILRSDGGVMYCHASSPITDWQYAASGVALNFQRIASNGDTFFMVGNSTATHRKLTYPANGSLTFAASGVAGGIRYDVVYDNGLWMAVNNGATPTVDRSEDNGATWTTVNTLLSASSPSARRIAYGNDAWVITSTGQSSAYAIIRSVDNGLTWVSVGVAISGIYRYILELKFVDGLFIAVGFGRKAAHGDAEGVLVATSPDGINWSYYPRAKVGAVNVACGNGFVITQTGRMVIVALNGDVFVSKPLSQVKPLPVMGGYRLQYAPTTKDPATGLAWTPEAAAASQFGMRVES